MAEPTSLVLRADPRKTAAPLFVLVLALIGMLALPIWLATRVGEDFIPWIWRFITNAPLNAVVVVINAAIGLWLGSVIYLLARQILAKPTITLTTVGFEVRDASGRLFTRWADVDCFDVAWDRGSNRDFVGWRYKPGAAPKRPWWQAKPHRNLDATVGMGWDGSVSNLRDTLDQWRTRHSGS